MPEDEKSNGKGIIIISGLIIGGILLVLMLKPKPIQSTPSSLPGGLITIQQMQDRIAYLEQQIKATSNLNMQHSVIQPIQIQPPESVSVQPYHQLLPVAGQNIIFNKDGSVTDADTVGQKYKNKENWVIKRDPEGAIVGVEVERNTSVGVTLTPHY